MTPVHVQVVPSPGWSKAVWPHCPPMAVVRLWALRTDHLPGEPVTRHALVSGKWNDRW
jgi:hypothetical protein